MRLSLFVVRRFQQARFVALVASGALLFGAPSQGWAQRAEASASAQVGLSASASAQGSASLPSGTQPRGWAWGGDLTVPFWLDAWGLDTGFGLGFELRSSWEPLPGVVPHTALGIVVNGASGLPGAARVDVVWLGLGVRLTLDVGSPLIPFGGAGASLAYAAVRDGDGDEVAGPDMGLGLMLHGEAGLMLSIARFWLVHLGVRVAGVLTGEGWGTLLLPMAGATVFF